MPIRFRCAYCNQLLGIAHRKAGTVVRCPTCSGQVVVPKTAAAPDEAMQPAAASANGGELVFERSDFDELFAPIDGKNPPADPKDRIVVAASLPDVPTPMTAPPRPVRVDVEPVAAPAPRQPPASPRGYTVSSRLALLLTAAVVLALTLAFTGGLLVGMWLHAG